jgi:hypothetical protein
MERRDDGAMIKSITINDTSGSDAAMIAVYEDDTQRHSATHMVDDPSIIFDGKARMTEKDKVNTTIVNTNTCSVNATTAGSTNTIIMNTLVSSGTAMNHQRQVKLTSNSSRAMSCLFTQLSSSSGDRQVIDDLLADDDDDDT